MKLCIDAGHGGNDSGVVGLGGLRESDLNLSIAWHVASLALLSGWGIMMTRSSDRFVGLEGRSSLANESRTPVDLFLSLHGNGAVSREAHGVHIFIGEESGLSSPTWFSARTGPTETRTRKPGTPFCISRRCRPCWSR